MPKISGSTRNFGLPVTRWFSKLNQVGSGIKRNTGLWVGFGYLLGTALNLDHLNLLFQLLGLLLRLAVNIWAHSQKTASPNSWGVLFCGLFHRHLWASVNIWQEAPTCWPPPPEPAPPPGRTMTSPTSPTQLFRLPPTPPPSVGTRLPSTPTLVNGQN